MPERWRVALIDSGLADGAAWPHMDSCRFLDTGVDVAVTGAVPDTTGHGTLVAHTLCSAASVGLLIGQVLDQSGRTTPAAVAAAIRWAVQKDAHLIHLSLGLREDRPVLAAAVADAVAAGCIIVASAPARGEVSFPARYTGVIRATGDARCAAGEISVLGSAQADYGACARYPDQDKFGGASVGAASFTGFVVAHLPAGSTVQELRQRLPAMARYRGAEQKLTAD